MLVMLAAMGCSDSGFPEALGAERQAISNGADDPNTTAVVVIGTASQKRCTGTFITPHLIITALHCFYCGPNVATGLGCACAPGDSSPRCNKTARTFDGWVSGTVLDVTLQFAWDGLVAGQGNAYQLDYVWFPERVLPDLPADVAVVHTVQPFLGTPIPVMPRQELPSPQNIGQYVGKTARIVGYSPNCTTVQHRRTGTVTVTRALDALGFETEDPVYAGVGGDSGGPLLFSIIAGEQAVEYVGGILSRGSSCPTTPAESNGVAYVPQGFLDALCRDQPHFEDCSFATDSDKDGIPDALDNCPNIANADQANCDAETGDTQGDACDPKPCPQLPGVFGAVVQDFVRSGTGYPWLYQERSGGGPARVAMRLTGYDSQALGRNEPAGVNPRY